MKKIVLLLCAACLVAGCDLSGGKSKKELQAQNDSLALALNKNSAELNQMMETFNEISEGFRLINEAENRVDLQRGAVGEGNVDARERMTQDIEFIRTQMQANKEQIEKLQKMLNQSNTKSSELQRALDVMKTQLNEKALKVAELEKELAAKDEKIAELDSTVTDLKNVNENLHAENQAQATTIATQDQDLHRAWFVFGTKSELKEQNILTNTGLFKKGDVLNSDEMNKSYFTECDIRKTKEIKLFSKDAELLSNHPDGSYQFVRDEQKELSLAILDPQTFWSTSKYLVILVK